MSISEFFSIGVITQGLVSGVVTVPVLILLHELGHVVAGLMVTRHPVSVVLDSKEKAKWHGRFGRLELWIAPFSWIYGSSQIQHDEHASVWQRALVIVAGPVITLLILIGLILVVASGVELGWLERPVNFAVFFATFQLLLTIVPCRRPRRFGLFGAYSGTASDGLRLIRVWRGQS